MHTAKVTIAGLSTSAVLIAALVALLTATGALVGYDNWRSVLPNSTDSHEVRGGGARTLASSGEDASGAATRSARVAPRGVSRRTRGGERGGSSLRTGAVQQGAERGPSGRAGRPVRDAAERRPGAVKPAPAGSEPAARPNGLTSSGGGGGSGSEGNAHVPAPATPQTPAPAPRTVNPVTTAVGDTVTQVTGGVGQVLTPVSKPVGDLVTNTGQTVGGLIGGLGGGK